jgi:Ca-activated chloride channel family protein
MLFAAKVCAQDNPQPQSSPTGPIVKMRLIVTDRDNHSVDEFRKEDLQILHGKAEQSILSVERDERPIDYGLVIDSSGSFRSILPVVIPAAKLIIKGNRPTDRTFIERFVSSDKIRLVQRLTSDSSQLGIALDKFIIEAGQSAVLDAIYAAVDHLAKQSSLDSERRKALVLITDGEDRNSFYKIEDLVKLLHQSAIQVFIIGITLDLDSESGLISKSSRKRAEALMKRVAEESGGRLFLLNNRKRAADELNNAIEQIVHDLQRQFLVTFQSDESEKIGFREIKVKINPEKKLTPIAPPGYLAAEAKASPQSNE